MNQTKPPRTVGPMSFRHPRKVERVRSSGGRISRGEVPLTVSLRTVCGVGVAAFLVLTATSCLGQDEARPVAELVQTIAHEQGVEESVVSRALAEFAPSGSEGELGLAREWEQAGSQSSLSELMGSVGGLAREADPGGEALKSAACSAVIDTLTNGRVPDGQSFLVGYAQSLVPSPPQAELEALVGEFNDLYDAASAGTLTPTDFRLTLLRLQYC